MNRIYLDNAATTQVDKEVLKAMEPYFIDVFGNASSLHSFGQEASRAVESARGKIAQFLNCSAQEIIFTSGATEANNLAILGTVDFSCHAELVSASNKILKQVQDDKETSNVILNLFQDQDDKKRKFVMTTRPHIITSAIEHPAVLETCQYLEKNGVEVDYIKPDNSGIINLEDIKNKIKNNTKLISIMYANNEIGTIQPIEEVGKLIKKVNAKRAGDSSFTKTGSGQAKKIIFHTDAVQATNYLNMDVKKLGVDLLSFSGHKIYGPKGIGVLFVKKGIKIKKIQHGGHHENNLRPGTLNVPGIVGFGKAVEMIDIKNNINIENLRNYTLELIQEKIKNIKLNGSLENRLPNNLNINIIGVEGEALLLGLDMEGIAVSTGSACSSNSLKASHVLSAIGVSQEESHGALRITLGKNNTRAEIEYFVEKLFKLVGRFRNMAPS